MPQLRSTGPACPLPDPRERRLVCLKAIRRGPSLECSLEYSRRSVREDTPRQPSSQEEGALVCNTYSVAVRERQIYWSVDVISFAQLHETAIPEMVALGQRIREASDDTFVEMRHI